MRISFSFTIAIVALLSIPECAKAQSGPRFLMASGEGETPVIVSPSAVTALRRHVSLSFKDVSLDDALRTLSARAGIRLSYSRQFVPLANRISLDARDITVAAAFTELLLGAGVDVVFASTDRASLVKREMPSPRGGTILVQSRPQPLDQIVVTGPIAPTRAKAVPNAMTVISSRELERSGITRIDQLFRGEVPGLYAVNAGSSALLDEVVMFSRGATALLGGNGGVAFNTNPIKTYLDGIELSNAQYLSQIDARTIDRIEIVTGPQAATAYGSNAINGVMQIFTKRGTPGPPRVHFNATTGIVQNNFSSALTPLHSIGGRISGGRGLFSYDVNSSLDHTGAWTPAKRTTRLNTSAGLRIDTNRFVADLSMRAGTTRNLQRGDVRQTQTSWRERGLVQPNGIAGLADPATSTLIGRTAGITLKSAPLDWWSHELSVGVDATSVETAGTEPGYITVADSLVNFRRERTRRLSETYTTTAKFPLGSIARTTLTLGADHWSTNSSLRDGSGLSRRNAAATSTVVNGKPGKNSGGFVQAQLALKDQLFFTYGLRAEWNPNYGDHAQPDYAPRFGVAYTTDIGRVKAKLRGSFGHATRPPAAAVKSSQPQDNALLISLYGNYDKQLENRDLRPEFQQGIEFGLELYVGNAASLSITRYNQTVDQLISRLFRVDSIRSLAPGPTMADSKDSDDYGYLYITQNVNVGSIRNDGWEAQATIPAGPFTTRGVYSWTRSRIIGVSPEYRNLLGSNTVFQAGRSFDFLPEHTWSISETFINRRTTVVATINGRGQAYMTRDFLFASAGTAWRDPDYKLRQNLPAEYRPLTKPHAIADLNVSHRLAKSIEAKLQIRNIANSYEQDMDIYYASLGRQTLGGLSLNF